MDRPLSNDSPLTLYTFHSIEPVDEKHLRMHKIDKLVSRYSRIKIALSTFFVGTHLHLQKESGLVQQRPIINPCSEYIPQA